MSGDVPSFPQMPSWAYKGMTYTYALTLYLEFLKTNRQYDITLVHLFLTCSCFSVLLPVSSNTDLHFKGEILTQQVK